MEQWPIYSWPAACVTYDPAHWTIMWPGPVTYIYYTVHWNSLEFSKTMSVHVCYKESTKTGYFFIKKCISFFSLGKATFLSLSTSSSEKNTSMTCCWSFHCFLLLQNILSLCFCLSLRTYKRGRLREGYINECTVLDTRWEQINWLDDITHLVQEPCLEENGEDGLEGKWCEI